MRKNLVFRLTLTVVGAGLLAGCSLLPGRAGKEPPSFASIDKGVLHTTLPNGLEVAIVPTRLTPVATSLLAYRVGSAEAPKGFPGTAHYLERLVFSGGSGLDAGQVASLVRLVGGNVSSQTTSSQTRFFFTVPADDLSIALHLQAMSMRGITQSRRQWAAVQQRLARRMAAAKTYPQYSVAARLRGDLFAGTRYAQDSLGRAAGLEQMTLARLERFHAAWYAPNNAILVIAGDVKPKKTLAEVRSLFGGIPRRHLAAAPNVSLHPVVPRTLSLKSHLAYGAAAIAMRFPGRASHDYPAAEVLSEIIRRAVGPAVSSSGGFGGSFTYRALPQAGIATIVAGYPAKGGGNGVNEALMLVLAKYMNGGVPPSLVRAAKLRVELRIEAQMAGVQGLATAWERSLAAGRASPRAVLEAIARVTPAEVSRVAARYIDLGKAEFATLTPSKSGPSLPLSSQGYGRPEPVDLSGRSEVPLPAWAKASQSRQPVIAGTKPVSFRLKNGLRLIVDRQSRSGAVELYGLVDSNSYIQVPKGEEGVNEVLAEEMQGATGAMDAVSFRHALDALGAEESSGTSFSLKVVGGNFSPAVRLLSDNLLHPSFTTARFKAAQKRVEQTVSTRDKNPSVRARRAFLGAVLPAKDPALRRPTTKSVKSLSQGEVERYYHAVFRPDMTTIVVIGNIAPKRAKRIVERAFGGWKSSGMKPDLVLPSGKRNPGSVREVKGSGGRLDQVRLAELLPIKRSSPSYFALQLGDELLSGNSYPGRLPTALRRSGVPIAYASSSFIAGLARSFYLIDFATEPSAVDTAVKVVKGEIAGMQKTPPSAAALAKARRDLLCSMILSETSYATVAKALLRRSRLALPLDEPAIAATAYARLTPREVSAAMRRWLDVHDFAEIVEGPPPPGAAQASAGAASPSARRRSSGTSTSTTSSALQVFGHSMSAKKQAPSR